MRLVLDTDVVVAAMRSPDGASAALLRAMRRGDVELLVSVALAIQYEAVCVRSDHLAAAGLSARQAGVFLDWIVGRAVPVESHFLWRPQLRDPADELVLDTAVNGRAYALVTVNRRDFADAPGRFGIPVLEPREALARVAARAGTRL